MLLGQGNAAGGIKAFEDAVELAKKEYGALDERTLQVRGSLAGAYQAVGRFDDAVAVMEKVAAAIEAKYGPDDKTTCVVICGLGKMYNTASRYDDALKCFRRGAARSGKVPPPGHVAILVTLEGLINTYINAGRPTEAEPYVRRKIQILEAKNGPRPSRHSFGASGTFGRSVQGKPVGGCRGLHPAFARSAQGRGRRRRDPEGAAGGRVGADQGTEGSS